MVINYSVLIGQRATFDLEEAIEYYNSKKTDLGIEFLIEFHDLAEFVSKSPKINQKVYKFYRRFKLKRFPYLVYYYLEDRTSDKRMVIIRINHSRKDQEKLKESFK